jgi:hypothetical protein
MAPAGHQLGPTEPVRDNQGRTVFRAACGCMPTGLYYYAPRLPALYARHQAHLDDLEAKSRVTHPSARRAS